jgi:ketosteroid isomerase-like protein
MTAEDNIAMVQWQFEAFGHGDIDVALAAVADEVDWLAPVSARPGSLPWAGHRHSRQQVADYFRELASAVRPQPFQDLLFTAAGDRVVVEGRNCGTVLATGRPYEHEWVMVFTIRDGQVVRFRHYYDPADITCAFG